MNKQTWRRAGFTLIEILLVIGILVVLGGVSVGVYSKIKSNTDKKNAKLLVDSVCAQIDRFQIDMGRYPQGEEGLKELVSSPEDEKDKEKWAGPYLKDSKIPSDPWGQELKYEKNEDSEGSSKPYKVWSTGPDKEDGTEDDIKNYKESDDS